MAKNERSILEGLNFGAPAPAAEPVPQPAQPEPQAPQAAQSMVFLGLCLANLFITAMRTP